MDAKGRMALPTRWRDVLIERCDGNLVITVNAERELCLWLYPLDEWEKIERKITALPSFNRQNQALKRYFVGSAVDAPMDKATGRILIPAKLREFANLQKEISLVGQGNKFEIWDGAHWDTGLQGWVEAGIDHSDLPDELLHIQL